MAPVIDGSPVFFLLSFQVLLGMVALVSVDVDELGLGTASSVHPFFIASCSLSFSISFFCIFIFCFVLLSHGLYVQVSGHPIRGRFQSMLV